MKIDKRGRKLSDDCLKVMGGKGRFKPKHGMRNTPEYYTWSSMKARCLNPHVESFKNYGARGIKVCPDWESSFEAFLNDMGKRPDGHSLERINPDGDYEPANTRWIPLVAQQSNKRTNVFLIYRGVRITATEYARITCQKPNTVRQRIRRGIPLEGASVCL